MVDRFEAPPPISWLPVVFDDDDGYITMRHARWAGVAAVKFVAAFVGADEERIGWFVERQRDGGDRKLRP